MTSDASQILIVPSSLPVARRRPSGLNATPGTVSVCPCKVSASWPLLASQILTLWSKLLEATRRLSGLYATPHTVLVCPSSERSSRPADTSQILTEP